MSSNGSSWTDVALYYSNTNVCLKAFTTTLAAPACTYSISQTSQSFTSPGGTGSITVTASSGCSWSATSGASWITITSGFNRQW